MSDSKPSTLSLRRSQAHHGVAMIELSTKVHAVRRSKIAFWTVATLVAVITTVIGSAFTAWYRVAIYGVLAGAVVGFVVAFGLFCWPALRLLWHWSAEIAALAFLLAAYLVLTSFVPWWATITVLAALVGGLLLLRRSRRTVFGLAMCAVSRHRLRVCFAAFVHSAGTGMTPLILLARPIPAGERIWIWLRPGLALADLESRLDRIATGCWAAECRIAPASRRFSALVRVDIARRNPLSTHVGSPLPTLVPTATPETSPVVVAATGLDLPDVIDTTPTTTDVKRTKALPAQPDPELADVTRPSVRGSADLADWI